MTHTETLNVLDEIESLVSDQLQVVSYKWLSRNFSISSKTAKGLLKDFVEKHGKGLEVVYTVSGWLKNKPSDYHTMFVSSSKLPEVEKEFKGTYLAHIYSVQASIPMDPAAIWNTEFVQAEELFRQPSAADNCLRDNRFCGVSNTFVKRDIEGTTENVMARRTDSVGTTMLHRLGAKRLVVVGVPPMGCMPLIKYLRGQKTCIDQLNHIAFSFNSKIIKNLELLQSEIGLKTIYVDAYSTIQEAIKNPKQFGFVEVSKGCCGTGLYEYGETCKDMQVCKDPTKYVFWDAVHPTQRMYQIIVRKAIASITEDFLV